METEALLNYLIGAKMSNTKLTDTALVRRHEKLGEMISKLNSKLCDSGFGDYKFSDLVALENKPKFVQRYIELVNESSELRTEAELRYGPDFIMVQQLIWRKNA